MAINFIVDDKVTFKVEGTETDAKGVARAFDFSLTAQRLDADELKSRMTDSADQTIPDFIVEITEGWSGIRDAAGAPVEFGADNLRQLLRRPGLASLCMRRYQLAIAAKEKN